MSQRLFKVAFIAECLGVSRQYVNRYCRENCPGAKFGTKVNVLDKSMRELYKSKGVDPEAKQSHATERSHPRAVNQVSQRATKAANARRADPASCEPDISQYTHMTLDEIAVIHGTDEEFRGWLDARKKQEEVIEKELKNKQRLGEVIDRDYVKKYIFGLVEELTSRLLVDAPSNLVTRIYAHKAAGDDKEEAEETARREISKLVKATKVQIEKRMS